MHRVCAAIRGTIAELPVDSLGQWGLHPDGFVLFVSTIESRKGHLDAFDAWVELIDQLGGDAVPQLVCVGNRGWLNDQIYDRLAIVIQERHVVAPVELESPLVLPGNVGAALPAA